MSKSVTQLHLVSAEKELFTGEAKRVILRGEMGDLEVLPGHSPLITLLLPGAVRADLADGQSLDYYISGGVVEVQPYEVSVLVDTAVRAEDLDAEAAAEAMAQARTKLGEVAKGGLDHSQALAEIAMAAAQLRVIQEIRRKIDKG